MPRRDPTLAPRQRSTLAEFRAESRADALGARASHTALLSEHCSNTLKRTWGIAEFTRSAAAAVIVESAKALGNHELARAEDLEGLADDE